MEKNAIDSLERVDAPDEHVEVVEGGDGDREVSLSVVQLLDVSRDLLYLSRHGGGVVMVMVVLMVAFVIIINMIIRKVIKINNNINVCKKLNN